MLSLHCHPFDYCSYFDSLLPRSYCSHYHFPVMTSFRNGSQDPEYKLTELTKVKLNFPGHNGTPRMPQMKRPPVHSNERQMIPKPMTMGKRTSYGSKDLPIFFVGQVILYITAILLRFTHFNETVKIWVSVARVGICLISE